ncbi:LacI family transcriptional regulator [Paenibacillus sp. H1-7]|uniref:LacI family DNA-binding transcriptional regulator n=1 Tax=Paenibacillus sp. H1-7 TaxID=2282849 RepID=UPI001EF8BED8|nr:LacI family DNA-binding transcriptional regulator [Paenibacillus sp. H1-7]ULL15221.1 LacI family transcriptional regulator [Paenibacillus sp. H1-7]
MNIRKIAEECGVSVSTVSRILNNKPDVNEDTRNKVIRYMNEHGFRPTVVTNRQDTIGVITPTISFPEYMGELMNGMMETAYSLDMHLTLIPYSGKALSETKDIAHFCRSNGLKGLFVINPPLQSALPVSLVQCGIPHVVIAASYPESDVSWVDIDNTGGCREAVQHLIQLGHERIALFHAPILHPCDVDRVTGYHDALQSNNIKAEANWVVELGGQADIRHMVQKVLQEVRPTAIFCTTYRGTLAVGNELQSLGVQVPDDISLVGFGDYSVSPLLNPPMTTVHQPIYRIGKTAVDTFEQLLRQRAYSKIQTVLPARLIVRESTRKATV